MKIWAESSLAAMSDNSKVHQSIQDYFSLSLLFFHHLSPEEREENFEKESKFLFFPYLKVKKLSISFFLHLKVNKLLILVFLHLIVKKL